MITPDEFLARFGWAPDEGCDDLERVNCDRAGEVGHSQCGVCPEHERPRFTCGCLAHPKTDAEVAVGALLDAVSKASGLSPATLAGRPGPLTRGGLKPGPAGELVPGEHDRTYSREALNAARRAGPSFAKLVCSVCPTCGSDDPVFAAACSDPFHLQAPTLDELVAADPPRPREGETAEAFTDRLMRDLDDSLGSLVERVVGVGAADPFEPVPSTTVIGRVAPEGVPAVTLADGVTYDGGPQVTLTPEAELALLVSRAESAWILAGPPGRELHTSPAGSGGVRVRLVERGRCVSVGEGVGPLALLNAKRQALNV